MSRSRYSPELAAAVCDAIAAGGGIRAIVAQPGMPSWGTICRWRAAHPEFAAAYIDARQWADELIVNEAMRLARLVRDRASARMLRPRINRLLFKLQKRHGRLDR